MQDLHFRAKSDYLFISRLALWIYSFDWCFHTTLSECTDITYTGYSNNSKYINKLDLQIAIYSSTTWFFFSNCIAVH